MINALFISYLTQFLNTQKDSGLINAHPKPHNSNANRLAKQQQPNKYRISKTSIIKATISHTIKISTRNICNSDTRAIDQLNPKPHVIRTRNQYSVRFMPSAIGDGLANHPLGRCLIVIPDTYPLFAEQSTKYDKLPSNATHRHCIYTNHYPRNFKQSRMQYHRNKGQRNLFYRHLQRSIRYNRATSNTTQSKGRATQISTTYRQ